MYIDFTKLNHGLNVIELKLKDFQILISPTLRLNYIRKLE